MMRESRTLRTVAVALAIAALGACSKRTAPAVAAASATLAATSSAAPPSGAVGRLAGPTAFDLVASVRGAALVWAPADRARGGLLELELDTEGQLRGGPRVALAATAVPGDVSDIAAAWVKERLALAWLERRGPKATVRAAWSAAAAAPFELGPAWSGPRTARGNVVVAAREDKALVFARGDQATCIEPGRSGCFAFGFHELDATHAVETGLPMSVPVPCTDDSAELAVVGSRFHYGVCTDTGKHPVTTMFTIQRDPEYARADQLLEGCTPTGTFVWRGAAWLIADCEGARRAARIGDDAAEQLDLRSPRLECADGALRVRTPSLDLALDEPRSGLAPLLPPDVAPAGSRAVWSGHALVVAASFAEQVRLTRRTCDGARLVTTTIAP